MKRRILALALAAALYFSALPAAAAEMRGNLETEELVPPRYEDAAAFSEGYAAVKQNGKWGYIDETGELVIPCRSPRPRKATVLASSSARTATLSPTTTSSMEPTHSP